MGLFSPQRPCPSRPPSQCWSLHPVWNSLSPLFSGCFFSVPWWLSPPAWLHPLIPPASFGQFHVTSLCQRPHSNTLAATDNSLLSLGTQFSSAAQLCPTLCDPMNRSTPGLPVHHQLPEFTQTHARWVSDAIQPSHPLSSLSPPAFNLSQNQGLFQWAMPFGEHNLDWWSPIIDFFYNSYFYPILDIFAKSKVF